MDRFVVGGREVMVESGCDEIEYQAAKRECFLDSNFKVEEASNMLGGFMCMMPPHPSTE